MEIWFWIIGIVVVVAVIGLVVGAELSTDLDACAGVHRSPDGTPPDPRKTQD